MDDIADDGRALRRLRNQEAVVEAILDLLRDGHPRPTALQVSERAGVSMRSIFRFFDDMETLHRAAIDRQLEVVREHLEALPEEGPLEDRIAALAGNRAEVFELIAPVRRSAIQLASESAPIRKALAKADGFFRNQVAAVFASELSDSPAPDPLLEALDAATSWEAWERLRTGQQLPVDVAEQVTRVTVSALLAPSLPL